MRNVKHVFVALALAGLTGYTLAGTTYVFTATCGPGTSRSQVVEWAVGDIDPGKEYLRVVTGTKYPSCSITDYNEATDKNVPKVQHKHISAVLEGIPFIGTLLCRLFC